MNAFISIIKSSIAWVISGIYIKIPPIVIHTNYIVIQRAPKRKETQQEIIVGKNDTQIISYYNEDPEKILNFFWRKYVVLKK